MSNPLIFLEMAYLRSPVNQKLFSGIRWIAAHRKRDKVDIILSTSSYKLWGIERDMPMLKYAANMKLNMFIIGSRAFGAVESWLSLLGPAELGQDLAKNGMV